MIKKSKSTDSVGKQLEDQVAQAKTGFAEAGSKSSHSVSSKDTEHGNKEKVVVKKKIDEEELDLGLNTGAESTADPIVLAQAETGTATDAAATGSGAAGATTGGEVAGTGAASGAATGAATGAEGAGAFALSDAALGTMILGGTIGVAAIASTGGGAAAAAAAPVTGFAISGIIALGKITDVTGLAVQAYKADGTALLTTSSIVNADGTYKINVGENYTGAILVRLTDTNSTTNYFDEGTGAAKDIATDLRAVVYAAAGNGATVTVMLTPLTELAVRNLVGDTGGDAGASVTTLGASVAAVTSTQVSDANNAVKTAFGLAGDIVATTPVTVDNTTGTVNDYGRALAAISGAETVQGASTSEVLNQLSLAIVTPATGASTLSQSAVDMLVQGAGQVQIAAAAAPTLYAANTATTLATTLTTAIGTSITGLTLSADTGASSKDFITSSTAAQTITATLGATLGTNKLWGSVDNGATWTDITASVAGTTLTWNVGVLTGANVIKLAQTASTVTAFTGATADLVANTKVTAQNYEVDTAVPAAPTVAVVTGAADATAAEATAGAVTVSAEKLSTVAITFTGTAGNVTKTLTGSGAAQTVALAAGDQATLGEGAVSVSAVATDVAGNASAAGTGSFNLDTVLPSLPATATASFAENTATVTAAYTAVATEANTVTYSLGGADAALFNIDTATGVVTFKASPNFEAPADAGVNNVYDLAITATDAAGNVSSQAVAITVTNVNEAPSLTSGAVASFAENATGTVYTATATDPDAGTTLTYALAGTDAALFNINSSTGAVTFVTSPNFEASADTGTNNVYDITVTASDGTLTTAAQAVAITVTNVNEAPTSTAVTPTTAAVNQAYSFNASGNFSDVDAGNVFAYGATGLPAGLSIGASTGIISGTATATGTSSVTVTATDSGGLTTSQTFNLPVVSAPVISSIAATVAQAKSGDALTFLVDFTEAVTVVTTGGTPTLTLNVGGTPMTATYISGTGNPTLTFTATASAGDSSAVAVTAINLNGGTVTGSTTGQSLVATSVGQTVSAFVIDNSNPAFTSATAANFAENGTGTAYASATTDATSVTYTKAGADAGLFNINATTGVVTFATAPNFEAPTDAGANNVYDINVTATDALGHAATQAVAITVTPVNEGPTVASGVPTTDTLVVGQALSGKEVASLFTDVDANDTLTYSQTGLPTELTLNPSTGVITGTPVTHNITNITFTATDSGGLTTNHTIAVSFVSAPTLASTIDNVTNFDVTSNIVLTASENVTAVTGKYIHIINDANDVTYAGFHGEATVNTQDILVTDATKVTITNNTITINPGFDLDLSNNYHITVDAGAFVNAGSVASVAVSDVAAMNFSTATPADGLLNVTNAITNSTSQAMDATGNLVASYSWMDIEGVGAPSSANGTVRDLSTGNIAMVFKDYDTTVVAGGAQDGIGAPDLYVSATNFGAGDLLYVDNQLNTQPNDLAISSFFNDTPSNGVTQISFGTGVGGLGGLVEVTPVGAPTPSFVTALELQTLLQTTYIPIVSA